MAPLKLSYSVSPLVVNQIIMNNSIVKLVLGLIIITGVFYLSNLTIKNNAIDGCFKTSGIYEYTNPIENVKTSAPQKEIYLICMADKGYKSTWK